MGSHISHRYVLKAARIILMLVAAAVFLLQHGIIDINDPVTTEWILSNRTCVYAMYGVVQGILLISDLIDAVINMFRQDQKL